MQVLSIHSWPQAIAHLDADAFFVSCEQAVKPELKGKCVAVGKERGIITALSYEAKAKGVKRGMFVSDAGKICPGIIILDSNYETYSLFSVRMFEILKRFSPIIEEYSIDEAFIDLTGLRRLHSGSYEDIALKIQQTIEKELSISVSVGISITKVLAKIASKYKKPRGITAIPGKEIHLYLKNIPIEDVWGIGPNTASLLKKFNVKTALDFALKNESFVKQYLSKPYIQIYNELKGNPSIDFIKRISYKSISKAKSFYPPSNEEKFIFSELLKNLELACAKARRFNLAAKELSVFLKTQDFQVSGIKVKLSSPSAMPLMLTESLREVFLKIYKPGYLYRQTGAVLSGLTEKIQYSLFDDVSKIEKITDVYNAIDNINRRFGRNSVHLAASSDSYSLSEQTTNLPLLDIKV
ncbi:MAG: DNA polymerase IV [Candidatus Acididesulfobacter diazotrophicus]|jgi:DNA polymerase-4/DNA polymerase V|uniref:DNA polymerase IV n=1 Tax=Candidatus Acididesulfobacter diazotrophicus TaxID=2597226 RepID=A0A519BLS4_9DELT|nr:MAG: DNA polymerase IV [Candidatus Acididesulfobacter diazotrophicus]